MTPAQVQIASVVCMFHPGFDVTKVAPDLARRVQDGKWNSMDEIFWVDGSFILHSRIIGGVDVGTLAARDPVQRIRRSASGAIVRIYQHAYRISRVELSTIVKLWRYWKDVAEFTIPTQQIQILQNLFQQHGSSRRTGTSFSHAQKPCLRGRSRYAAVSISDYTSGRARLVRSGV